MANDKYSQNRQLAYDLLKQEGYTDIGDNAEDLFKNKANGELAYKLLSEAGYTDIGKDYNEFAGMIYGPEETRKFSAVDSPAPAAPVHTEEEIASINQRRQDAAEGYAMFDRMRQTSRPATSPIPEEVKAKMYAPKPLPSTSMPVEEMDVPAMQADLERLHKENDALISEYDSRFKRFQSDFDTTSKRHKEDEQWLKENKDAYHAAKDAIASVGGRLQAETKEDNLSRIAEKKRENQQRVAPIVTSSGGMAPGYNPADASKRANMPESEKFRAANDLLSQSEQTYRKGSKGEYGDNIVANALTAAKQYAIDGALNNIDMGTLTAGLSEGTSNILARDAMEKYNRIADEYAKSSGKSDDEINGIVNATRESAEKLNALGADLEKQGAELTAMEETFNDMVRRKDPKAKSYAKDLGRKIDAYNARINNEYEPIRADYEEKRGAYDELMSGLDAAVQEKMTDGERAILDAVEELTNANYARKDDVSIASAAGAGFEDTLEYMLDFFATGGFTKAGMKAATKLAASKLMKHLGKTGAKIAAKGLTDLGVAAARTAAVFPRNIQTYGEQLAETVGKDNLGRYQFDKNHLDAALNSTLTNFIGYWTEGFGEYLSAGEQALFREVTKAAPKTAVGKTLNRYRGSIGKYLDYGKFDGMLNEVAEEAFDSAFNALAGFATYDEETQKSRLGDKEALKQFASGEQLATLALSFLPLQAVSINTNMKAYNKMKQRYNHSVYMLNPYLRAGVIDRAELDELANTVADKTPEEIKDKMIAIAAKARKKNNGQLPEDFTQNIMGYLEGTFAMNLRNDAWENSQDKMRVVNAYTDTYEAPNPAYAWDLAQSEEEARAMASGAGFSEEELEQDSYMLAQKAAAMKGEQPERANVLENYATVKAAKSGLKDGYDNETKELSNGFADAVMQNADLNGNVITAQLPDGTPVYVTSKDADVTADGMVSVPTGVDGAVSYVDGNWMPHTAKASTLANAVKQDTETFLMDAEYERSNAREAAFQQAERTVSPAGQSRRLADTIGQTVYVSGNGAYEPIQVVKMTNGGAKVVITGDKEALKGIASVFGIQSPGGTNLELNVEELYPLLAKNDDDTLATSAPEGAPQAAPEAAPAEATAPTAQPEMNVEDLIGSDTTITVDGTPTNVFVEDVSGGIVRFNYEDAEGNPVNGQMTTAEFVEAMNGTQMPAPEAAPAEEAVAETPAEAPVETPVAEETAPAEAAPVEEAPKIPLDKDGNPIYDAPGVSIEDALEDMYSYTEDGLSEADVDEYIINKAAEAEKGRDVKQGKMSLKEWAAKKKEANRIADFWAQLKELAEENKAAREQEAKDEAERQKNAEKYGVDVSGFDLTPQTMEEALADGLASFFRGGGRLNRNSVLDLIGHDKMPDMKKGGYSFLLSNKPNALPVDKFVMDVADEHPGLIRDEQDAINMVGDLLMGRTRKELSELIFNNRLDEARRIAEEAEAPVAETPVEEEIPVAEAEAPAAEEETVEDLPEEIAEEETTTEDMPEEIAEEAAPEAETEETPAEAEEAVEEAPAEESNLRPGDVLLSDLDTMIDPWVIERLQENGFNTAMEVLESIETDIDALALGTRLDLDVLTEVRDIIRRELGIEEREAEPAPVKEEKPAETEENSETASETEKESVNSQSVNETQEEAPAEKELTEDEIRNSGYPDEDVIDAAIDYINGDRSISSTAAYNLVKEYVRPQRNATEQTRGDADGTQLDGPVVRPSGVGAERSGGEGGELGGDQESGTAERVSGNPNGGVPAGEGSTASTTGVGQQSDVPDSGSNVRGGRGGSRKSGRPNADVPAENGTPSQSEQPAGRTEAGSTDIAALGGELEDLLKQFGETNYSIDRDINGLDSVSYSVEPEQKEEGELSRKQAKKPTVTLSFEGLTPKQMELAGKIIFSSAKLGYAFVKTEGLSTFNDFRRWFKSKFGDAVMKGLNYDESSLDAFINEVWNTKLKIDGQRLTLAQHASELHNEELRKNSDLTPAERTRLQKEANEKKIPFKAADRKNIAEALPQLNPGQWDDLVAIERQFYDPSHNDYDHAYGKGMMITNGTGTGKTYTGLGTIKRFVDQGKGRILLVAPAGMTSEWVDKGNAMGIKMSKLADTKDKGEGVVVTSYQNFRENKALYEDDFDLVVYDESHNILENQQGDDTIAYEAHKRITNKNVDEALDRLVANTVPGRRRIELELENKALEAEAKKKTTKQGRQIEIEMRQDEIAEEISRLNPVIEALKPQFRERAEKAVGKTKVLFLSATPFNTIENLKYAEGYIYQYPKVFRSDGTEITDEEGRKSAFVTEWFRGDEPMEEREIAFGDHLLDDLETVSYRELENGFDHSRDFPDVSGNIMASRFNFAFQSIMRNPKYTPLKKFAESLFGNSTWTTQLYETMKASALRDRLKEHLDAGRKIVIFHDRMHESVASDKLPAVGPPFQTILDMALMDNQAPIASIMAFKQEFADILKWEAGLDYRPVQEQVVDFYATEEDRAKYAKKMEKYEEKMEAWRKECEAYEKAHPNMEPEELFANLPKAPKKPQLEAESVAIYNGEKTDKEKEAAKAAFNDDNSKVKIICVTTRSGGAGLSLHDTTGKHPRVMIQTALPVSPIGFIQAEGRIFRWGNKSNAAFEYPRLGLDVEAMKFAMDFNAKAETVENLAHGFRGRGLKDSIMTGFYENSGNVPIAGQGIGGVEMDKRGNTLKGMAKAKHDYGVAQRKGIKAGDKSIPETIGYVLSGWGMMQSGDQALIPFAGRGSIARYMPKGVGVSALEQDIALQADLFVTSGGDDFKLKEGTFTELNPINKADVVILNGNTDGGLNQIETMRKGFLHLSEGGRLIAIVPDAEKEIEFTIKDLGGVLRSTILVNNSAIDAGNEGVSRIIVVDKVSKPAMRAKAGAPTVHDLTKAEKEGVPALIEAIKMPERIIDKQAIAFKKIKTVLTELRKNKMFGAINIYDENGARARVGFEMANRLPKGTNQSKYRFDSLSNRGFYYTGKWFQIPYSDFEKVNENNYLITSYQWLKEVVGLPDDAFIRKAEIESNASKETIDSFREMYRQYMKFIRAGFGLTEAQIQRVASGLQPDISAADIDTLNSYSELRAKFEAANHGDDERQDLYDKVAQVGEKIGLTIGAQSMDRDFLGGYNNKDNTLMVNKNRWNGLSDEKRAQTLLHEFIHSVTVYALAGYTANAAGMSDALFDSAKLAADVYDQITKGEAVDVRPFTGQYAIENEKELLAEMASSETKEKLQNRRMWVSRTPRGIRVSGSEMEGAEQTTAWNLLNEALDGMLKNFDKSLFDRFRGRVSDFFFELDRDGGYTRDADLGAADMRENGPVDKTVEDSIKSRAIADGTFMKAPNGKPSKLTEKQWLQVRTSQFKNWFGDWENDPANASKVVDENGEPRVMYHGTKEVFNTFKTGTKGTRFAMGIPYEVESQGFFFTASADNAGEYGRQQSKGDGRSRIVSAFLNMRNPADLSTLTSESEKLFKAIVGQYPAEYNPLEHEITDWWQIADKQGDEYDIDLQTKLQELGYDGIIFAEKDGNKSYFVLSSNQIKSATDNSGSFSSENPDIRYREGTTEERRIVGAEIEATNKTLDRMGEALGVKINRVGSAEMPEGHQTAKGYYDPETGEMTICMDNVTDERDAIATVLHETVGHKGLRELFGNRFNEAMVNIYASLDNEGKRWVNAYIGRHNLQPGDEAIIVGMEEYMAHLAERGDFKKTVWERIKEILGKIVDLVFGTDGFVFTDRELNYILRASYEHLKNPDWLNTDEGRMLNDIWKRELGINETDPNKPTDPDGPGTGLRFRDGDTGLASENYNDRIATRKVAAITENQNADLPVKIGMDEVMKETGKNTLNEDEDYLMRHNQSSSRAESEFTNYELFKFTPLMQQVREIQSRLMNGRESEEARQQAYERILDYMYAVSGLERNAYKNGEIEQQKQDAIAKETDPQKIKKIADKYDKMKKDWSGLTSLMHRAQAGWQDAENDARAMISDFEKEVGSPSALKELWDRVRACTDFSLEHAYKHGLLTRDEFEKLHGTESKPRMWEYYLPLRGFSENTAEQEFNYSTFTNPPTNGVVVKKMKGRWTEADNPLANILNIAETEIVQGNDNWARQALYRFVLNAGKNSLLSMKEPWYVKDSVTGKWSMALPAEGETLEHFEEDMKNKRAKGEAKYGRAGLKLDNIMANKAHRNEHAIHVKVGGIDKIIWVNGNPAMAKAVTGFGKKQTHQMIRRASRVLSNLFTTYSLNFSVKNLIRDTIYSRIGLIVKEDADYRNKFRKNWRANFGYGAFAYPMVRLAKMWETGELQSIPEDKRTATQQMFIDFMLDGGQTGYTIINSVDEIKKSLEASMRQAGKEIKKAEFPIFGKKVPVFDAYAGFVKTLNEGFELLTRFTAYQTSRDMGRSGQRAAYDAKEISVNFNRRGAQTGEGVWGNIAAYLGATHYFYNAGVQGFDNFLRLFKADKKTMSKVVGGFVVMGILTPLINSMISGALGGGDDDWYWNLPEWVRRNNLIIGLGNWYLAVPLPVEFRAPYGIGDIAAAAFCYQKTPNRKWGDLTLDLISTASGILPVNPVEGYTSNGNLGDAALRMVAPDAGMFFVDWATNRDYTGRPLWKENPFSDTVPKSQGAYASTPRSIVIACQKLAEVSAGNIDIAPGLVRDFMNNYGGGFFRVAEDASKIVTGLIGNDPDRPLRYDNLPFFSGFTGHIDEDRSNSFVNGALQAYSEVSDGNVRKLNALLGTDEVTAAIAYDTPETLYDMATSTLQKARVKRILESKDYRIGKEYRNGMNNQYKMKQYERGEKKGQWYKSKEVEQKGVNTLKKEWKDLREQWAAMPNSTAAEKSAKAEKLLEVQDAWHAYYDAQANLAEKLMNIEYGK